MNDTGQIVGYIRRIKENGSRVVIVSHHNPDGDAVGSALAFTLFLRKLGLEVTCALPNRMPPFLAWMKGAGEILVFSEAGAEVRQALNSSDAVFCLDFNALHRLNDLEKPVRDSGAGILMIDHHPNPSDEFALCLSDIDTSSTSELIFRIIEDMDCTDLIDEPIAEALYVGIMTDTGSFSFACDRPSTYHATARLIERSGISTERIHRLVYDTYSESRMRLLGYCLSEKLVILPEFQSAYICLTKDELARFNYIPGDTEGVVNYALSIKGIKVAALFIERSNHIRISFRSKGSFAVNQVASEHFEGGGHRNAAGGNSYVPMEESLERFRAILRLYQNEISESTDA